MINVALLELVMINVALVELVMINVALLELLCTRVVQIWYSHCWVVSTFPGQHHIRIIDVLIKSVTHHHPSDNSLINSSNLL